MTVARAESIQARARAASAEFGTRPAVGLPGQLRSFEETFERSLRCATAFSGVGAEPGTHIGVLSTNGPWWLEVYLACCEGGFVEVSLNLRFSDTELSDYVSRVQPSILLASPDQAPRAQSLADTHDSITSVIGVGDGHGLPLDYESLIVGATADEHPLRDPRETVLLCSTSGTSGRPKIVEHTQATTAAGLDPLMERFDLGPGSRMVTGLGMYFATAYSGWTAPFFAGAQHTILPGFDPAVYVDAVESLRATHAFLGPAPVFMMADAGLDLRRLHSLEYLSMGGAPADPSRLSELAEVFGQRLALQFAMTELAVGTALVGDELVGDDGLLTPAHTSVGRPLGGMEARLEELEAGVGELQVRGPMVTPGYLDDPSANAESFDGEWFRTGDVARIDDDGNIFIVDRRKDLIVSGGINIAPLEIEQAVMRHPAVAAAGACGVPHPTYGEAVHVSVVPRAGESITPDEVVEWCSRELASVKKPRSVDIVDALPMSSTGKLLRRELRRR